MTTSSVRTGGAADWESDFFGTLNAMPPEPVAGISTVLESMATLPAFDEARLWVLRNLGLSEGSSVIDVGCGTGAALSDVLSVIGPNGQVVGIDPTEAFIDQARRRASGFDAPNARYELGDIRKIPYADETFDACFCDKILIHVGPAKAALSEMMRVTRQRGRVGAIEWLPFFLASARDTGALDAFNAVFRKAVHNYFVSANLARYFHEVGLKNVRLQAALAHTNNLDTHPFWRAFIFGQMPMFTQVGLIDEATGNAFLADIEELNRKGEFSASFIVKAAVGTK
jgi:ubiquinone/menaquinone biosynthesis C-methylase UbiE